MVKKTKRKTNMPFCSVFRTDYVNEQMEKRKQEINNPEMNHCVLLKNVPMWETPDDVFDTLEILEYNVEEVERFRNMPVVKVTFSEANDVKRALEEQNIWIGYFKTKCEPFDKYRRRPRSHFHQCKNCFKLNHVAKECPRPKVCKFCGMKNHTSENCRNRKNRNFQKCVLCRGKHPSDSILCPVIQKTRNSIGVKLSRREKKIVEKKIELKENKKEKVNKSVASYKDMVSGRQPKAKNNVPEKTQENMKNKKFKNKNK